MTKFNTVAGVIVAAAFAISGVYAVNTIVEHNRVALPRVLVVGGAAGEHWKRTLMGARAAAKEYGVELETEVWPVEQTAEQQSDFIRRACTADYEAIAISLEDPASQVDLINDLAKHTKLVTLGKDAENSKRLCHIGFSQVGAGKKAAWLARLELTHAGEVALLTTASGGQDDIVRQRLDGFQEEWTTSANSASLYPMVAVSIGGGARLSETLANSKLALIVAFDVDAAESAIEAMSSRPESERIPIIALDLTETILAAIDDGRVSSAVYNDSFEDGYEAVQQLAKYARNDDLELPTPGCGTIMRSGEVVQKSNVASIRGRLITPVNDSTRPPQLHLSSAKLNATLFAH